VPIEVKVGGRGATPEYASDGAAGADLRASESLLISPGERAAVPTDIHIEIPEGHVGLIWPRSGLALSQGIDTLAGVVDSDYRGEVRVVLINHGDEALLIKARDRVAQLLIQKVEHARFVRSDDLEGSERGSGGFGSTGR
jgi:dUTP pyrophosphatase